MKNSKHLLYWSLAALAAIVVCYIEASCKNDFHIYLSASTDLFAGKNIYTERYHTWYHFLYSPLFLIVIKPFTWLPVFWAQLLWLLLDCILVVRTWQILTRLLGPVFTSEKQKIIFHAVCFLLMLRFLRDNIHYGQLTLIMLYLSMEGLRLVLDGKKITGGLLIALAVNFKIFPIVLFPYLLYRKEFKAAAALVFFFGVFLFLPALAVGYEQNIYLLKEWWAKINPAKMEHIVDTDETTFHSLSTLIPTLFMDSVPDPHALSIRRNIANLSVQQVGWILNGVRLIFICCTIFFLRLPAFVSAKSIAHRFREVSYLFLVVPLIFPHQQCYAFYLLLPACMYTTWFIMNDSSRRSKIILIGLLSFIFILFNAEFLLGQFCEYYEHFKIVTYGAIIFAGVLLYCKPERLRIT